MPRGIMSNFTFLPGDSTALNSAGGNAETPNAALRKWVPASGGPFCLPTPVRKFVVSGSFSLVFLLKFVKTNSAKSPQSSQKSAGFVSIHCEFWKTQHLSQGEPATVEARLRQNEPKAEVRFASMSPRFRKFALVLYRISPLLWRVPRLRKWISQTGYPPVYRLDCAKTSPKRRYASQACLDDFANSKSFCTSVLHSFWRIPACTEAGSPCEK